MSLENSLVVMFVFLTLILNCFFIGHFIASMLGSDTQKIIYRFGILIVIFFTSVITYRVAYVQGQKDVHENNNHVYQDANKEWHYSVPVRPVN